MNSLVLLGSLLLVFNILLTGIFRHYMRGIGPKRGGALSGYLSLFLGVFILQNQATIALITPTVSMIIGVLSLVGIIFVFAPISNPQSYLGPFGHVIKFATEIGWVSGYLISIFIIAWGL